jgi:hypothetical protein
MRWIIHPEIRSEEKALNFCRRLALTFNTVPLDWVRVDLGRGRICGAYGRCWYPVKLPQPKGYRISIQVPGPFPYRHRRYVKPIYRNSDGSWPPVPPNTKPAGYVEVYRNGLPHCWLRLTTEYLFESREIAIVHVFGHEMFHFLRRSRQIPGRNRENEADQFAVSVESVFRERVNGV